ncbi:hypothetical protein GOV06_00665 [Candidatus Woesearchaeota archaeon]|nr:hypothetical protein [Candidatus Woesearchaeota archaeon]
MGIKKTILILTAIILSILPLVFSATDMCKIGVYMPGMNFTESVLDVNTRNSDGFFNITYSCYNSDDVLQSPCYEDGDYYIYFHCDTHPDESPPLDCGGDVDYCSNVAEETKYRTDYGSWQTASASNCPETCDGLLSQYECSSSDKRDGKNCTDCWMDRETDDQGSTTDTYKKRNIICKSPYITTSHFSGIYNFYIDSVNKDFNQIECTSFVHDTADNVPKAWQNTAPEGYKCCGDDIIGDMYTDNPGFDGGTIAPDSVTQEGIFLCANDTSDRWQWFHRNTVVGDIFHIGYGDYDVIPAQDPSSPGELIWYACDSDDDGAENFDNVLGQLKLEGGQVSAGGFDYICHTNADGTEQFVECNGDTNNPHNRNAGTYGNVKRTGESIWLSSAQEFRFCTSKETWVDDLDGSDPETCEVEFQWTGSRCCGDDLTDTYNDIGWPFESEERQGDYIGGCFNNLRIEHNKVIADMNLLENPDFAQATASWITGGNIEIDSEGRLELSIDAYASQEVTRFIKSGETYTLSSYIRTSGPTGEIYARADGDKIEESVINLTGYTLDDTLITTTFTVPQTFDTIDIYLEARPSNDSTTGRAYFDNIQLSFAKRNIMNINGSFYGCNMDEVERTIYKELNTQGNIIGDLISVDRNIELCTVLGDYFCSESFGWNDQLEGAPDIYSRDTDKSTPVHEDIEYSESCCPEDYCWNGTWCVGSEITALRQDLIAPIWIDENSLFICDEGEWKPSSEKQTWNKLEIGFCPSVTQCLVDPNGNKLNSNNPETYAGPFGSDNPQCIESGQYIEDHYCYQGEWTSRTKILATELLKLADNQGNQNDYAVFCGDYTSTLNKYDYQTSAGIKIEDYIRGTFYQLGPSSLYTCSGDPNYVMPCVNSFCVLRFIEGGDEKIIAATSLNQPINSPQLPFLETLDKDSTYCDFLIPTSTMFGKCSTDEKIWYNNSMGLIIFSNQEFDLEPNSIFETFLNWIIHPVESLLAAINPQAQGAVPLVYDAEDYNDIYAVYKGGKSITAILEPYAENPFLAANYIDFDQDICKSIQIYDNAKFGGAKQITCNQTDGSFYVFSQGPEALILWNDLTAKLRID